MNNTQVINYKTGVISIREFTGGGTQVSFQITGMAHKQQASSVSVAKGKITNAIKNGLTTPRRSFY